MVFIRFFSIKRESPKIGPLFIWYKNDINNQWTPTHTKTPSGWNGTRCSYTFRRLGDILLTHGSEQYRYVAFSMMHVWRGFKKTIVTCLQSSVRRRRSRPMRCLPCSCWVAVVQFQSVKSHRTELIRSPDDSKTKGKVKRGGVVTGRRIFRRLSTSPSAPAG